MKRNRIVIYPQDVRLITGRGVRQAQRILRNIRKRVGKHRNQYVTIEEFSGYSGLSVDELEQYLR